MLSAVLWKFSDMVWLSVYISILRYLNKIHVTPLTGPRADPKQQGLKRKLPLDPHPSEMICTKKVPSGLKPIQKEDIHLQSALADSVPYRFALTYLDL